MDKHKNITKRLTAYLLDAFLVYLLIYLISSIRVINPTYNKLLEVTNTYNEAVESYEAGKIDDEEYYDINTNYIYEATRYNISTNIVFVVVAVGYFVFFQKYNKGQTLGKKIMKIKVTDLEGKEANLGQYFLRLLPMYYILLGSVVPFLLSTVLVFIMKASSFAILYSVLVYVFMLLGIISFVMAYIREDKRGLHDLIARTKVVEE